jgi:hypothetical protein
LFVLTSDNQMEQFSRKRQRGRKSKLRIINGPEFAESAFNSSA